MAFALPTPAAQPVPGQVWLQYASPEDAGFSSEGLTHVKAAYDDLGAAAVFVVYKGHVLCNWGETSRRFRLHSARKSLMSALYGVHIDNGDIDPDKTLADLGIDDQPPLTDQEKTARIADLLAARSGVYRPAAYEPARNGKPPRGSHAPGTHWCYNNWDFNTLVTIFEQETGTRIFTEFDRAFAQPLQMQDYAPEHGYYHYEIDKSIHPAYPIRMSARDMARVGLLYLNEGLWGERRILSRDYVRLSTSAISQGTLTGGYGYLWWTHDRQPFADLGMYSALGLGGQTIDVIPGADLVIVMRGDTYTGQGFDDRGRLDMYELLLAARTGDPVASPRLEPVPEPTRPYAPSDAPAIDLARYEGSWPLLPGQSVEIRRRGDGLTWELGEGPVPLLVVGDDLLMVEDFQYLVRFVTDGDHRNDDARNGETDGSDARRRLVCVPLSLLPGYQVLQQGDIAGALEVFEDTRAAFPDDETVRTALAEAHVQQGANILAGACSELQALAAGDAATDLETSSLTWALVGLLGRAAPPDLPPAVLDRYAGHYGPRRVEIDGDCLYYSREGRPRNALSPLTETIFALDGTPGFRVRFVADASGRFVKLEGLYEGGRRDVTWRDGVAAE